MATAETIAAEISQTDPMSQELPPKVRFASRGRNLCLIRVQSRTKLDSAGNRVFTDPLEYDFEPDGFLEVYPGKDVLADKFDPRTGDFEKQDVLEWLRSHALFGREDGFWEVAPIAPDPEPLMVEIMRAAVAGDEERLVAIHEAEVTSWKRETVLAQCRTALLAIEAQTSGLSEPERHENLDREGGRPAPPPAPSPDEISSSAPRKPDGMEIHGGRAPFNPDAAPPKTG